MVLDKLGSSLKNTLAKIAKSMFVDERIINELVKDIQKALLQADVNVKLVFELTNSIKKRALAEKTPAGVSQREYLIKIVYEELVKFLGGEKNEIVIDKTKKPFKIMMVGLYGSGKCVHKDSRIVLSDGNISRIEDFYEKYKTKQEKIDDGWIVDLEKENVFVPSFNPKTMKIETKKITHLWKLDGKELLQVYLDNGNDFNVKVTPEHPFFVLRGNEVVQIRAEQLTEDDYIAVPKNYLIEGKEQYLFEDLKILNLDIKYKLDYVKGDVQNKILPKLTFKRDYCKLTQNLKKGITPISLIDNYSEKELMIKKIKATKFINFPTYLTDDLAEFLGYVMGDGHLDKEGKYVEITTENPEIKNRVIELSKKIFGLEVYVKKDPRTKKTEHLIISSTTLIEIIHKIFGIPLGKKGKLLSISKVIFESKNSIIQKFLKAYFDCDAYAALDHREIEFSSESRIIALQIASLLQRFGIASSLSKKYINKIPYWRIHITARYAEIYQEKIGFIIKHKKERSEKYKLIGSIQGCGKQDMIPLGNCLRELRFALGFTIGEIQKNVSSYGIYEKTGWISRESLMKLVAVYQMNKKGNLKKILEAIRENTTLQLDNYFVNGFLDYLINKELVYVSNGQLILTEKARDYLVLRTESRNLLDFFELIVNSDINWMKVRKIENHGYEEFVYDLTVEENHSFIADNIIVHNTTSIGKIARYYSNRGFKVAAIGLDVHRPAAPLQLQQICDKIKVQCFIDEKEKNALKIYKKFEKDFKDYDLLIIDTAGRDALSEDLVKEITELNNYIKADENLLVISADIGQAAQKQAESFHNSCGVNGVVVSKLDGTAKGGGALSACAVTKAPIKFIGIGEKPEDIEVFNPKGFVGRLLGMGDLEALLEKAREAIDENTAEDLGKKMLKGDFNFLDLYEQMSAMSKMGPLSKIVEMIPGFGGAKIPKEMLEGQEGKLKKWKHMMQSMTKEELEDPEIITKDRIERIAKGSGCTVTEVRELLKQYKETKKMMKMLGGSEDPTKLMKKFKGKMPKGFGA